MKNMALLKPEKYFKNVNMENLISFTLFLKELFVIYQCGQFNDLAKF